jgi:hypothetical protein
LSPQGIFDGNRVLLAQGHEINREIFIAMPADTTLAIVCAEGSAQPVRRVRECPEPYALILWMLLCRSFTGATQRVKFVARKQGGFKLSPFWQERPMCWSAVSRGVLRLAATAIRVNP